MKARFSFLKTIMLGSLAFSFASYAEVQRPIIEKYAKHAQYLDIKISPEGTYLASTSRSEDGLISLTILDIKKQEVVSITRGRGKESVSTFNWLNDDRLLLTMAREVGSFEQPMPTGELIAMNADGSDSTILTGWRSESGDKRFSQIVDYLPSEPDAVVVYSVDLTAKEPYLDLYKMKVSNGRKSAMGRMPLRRYAGSGAGVITGTNGNVLAMYNADPNEDNKQTLIVRSSPESEWYTAYEAGAYDPFFQPLVFLADNKTLVGLSTIETDTRAIATFNVDTKKHTVLYAHDKVDVTPILHIQNGQVREVQGASFEYLGIDAVFLDGTQYVEEQKVLASLTNTFKGQLVEQTSSTNDTDRKSVV